MITLNELHAIVAQNNMVYITYLVDVMVGSAPAMCTLYGCDGREI